MLYNIYLYIQIGMFVRKESKGSETFTEVGLSFDVF